MAHGFKLAPGKLIRSQCWLALALCLLTLQGAWAETVAHLNRVVVNGRDGHIVVSLSLSHKVAYHYFELNHPLRLVVDMIGARGMHPDIQRSGGTGIKNIVFGQHRDNRLRAVFSLSQQMKIEMQPSPGHPNTLVATLSTARSVSSQDESPSKTHTPIPALPQVQTQPVAVTAAAPAASAIVVIDPGHGGKDPGTSGPHGLQEKTVTLAIGKIVAQELNRTPGIHAYMTRRTDRYVTLVNRVLFAQRHHANVFVSIHENAYDKNPSIDGGTCFALSLHGASDAEAQQEAREENSHDRAIDGIYFSKYGHSVNAVLTDLFQTSAMQAESHLGEDIIKQFGKVEPIYDHKVQRANFAVLRDPLIPSVLCETSFLSNPRQAQELHQPYFRARIAHAIYKGIVGYLRTYPPIRIARQKPSRRYIVKPGDTLSGIADKFNVGIPILEKINGLQSADLQVGEHLTIPSRRENS